MIYIPSVYPWGCLLSSFAMAFDTTPSELVKHIGHDGSEIIWPEFDDHRKHRGFDPYEFFDYGVKHGKPVAAFFNTTGTAPKGGKVTQINHWDLSRYLKFGKGVISSETHAAAWNRRVVYDPTYGIMPLKSFGPIIAFYMVNDSNQNRIN